MKTMGITYLLLILARSFIKVFVPLNLILPGDSPGKTGGNMIFSCDLIRHVCNMVLSLIINGLFKPVSRSIVLVVFK